MEKNYLSGFKLLNRTVQDNNSRYRQQRPTEKKKLKPIFKMDFLMGKRVTGRGFRKMSFKTLYQKINRRKKIENKEEINHKR